jgi:hypothetical protein
MTTKKLAENFTRKHFSCVSGVQARKKGELLDKTRSPLELRFDRESNCTMV